MKFEELAKQFALKNLPDSEVELSGEAPWEVVEPYRASALAHIAEHLELPGFRPGKVPADVALKKVGEIAVLEEAAGLFIKDFYPELVEVKKIDAVGRPEIKVTKLAPQNPVAFTMCTSVYPEVAVPKNWKFLHEKVALEEPKEATDEEVSQTLTQLQKSRAQKPPLEGAPDIVPDLNDEFAKSVGAFDSLMHLKEQVKKGIGEEKARAARDARRGKLVDGLVSMTPLAVPRVFVESELDKIMAQMQEDLARMGLKFDDYLKHTGKTADSIRQEFRDQAHKRAALQLILNKLAEEEKIAPDPEAVEVELKHALAHFPDANPELLRIHIETVLRNEKVLQKLEGTPEK